MLPPRHFQRLALSELPKTLIESGLDGMEPG